MLLLGSIQHQLFIVTLTHQHVDVSEDLLFLSVLYLSLVSFLCLHNDSYCGKFGFNPSGDVELSE